MTRRRSRWRSPRPQRAPSSGQALDAAGDLRLAIRRLRSRIPRARPPAGAWQSLIGIDQAELGSGEVAPLPFKTQRDSHTAYKWMKYWNLTMFGKPRRVLLKAVKPFAGRSLSQIRNE